LPFTFSHPAAVLPLAYLPKRWISMTGLVIGSLAPDFEYFLRMRISRQYSHSWTGMFWFELPLSIIACFIFHYIIRDHMINNLPGFLRNRLTTFKDFNWIKYFKKNFIVVIFSILIGVATHILWDGFTDMHGQFVLLFDRLKDVIIVDGFEIPLYKILQHTSTLLGAIIIFYALFQLPPVKNDTKTKPIFFYWLLIVLISSTVVFLRITLSAENLKPGNVIVTGIAGVMIGMVVTPILYFSSSFSKN
jgi:hypothetical protein